MARLALVVAAAAAVSWTSVAASGAGIAASLSQAGGQYALNAAIPALVAKISTISLPNVDGKSNGFKYDLTGFSCHGFNIGGGSVTMSPSGGVQVSLGNMGISCHGSWSFKLSSWPHLPKGSGTVDASLSGTTATLGLGVTAVNGHPQLSPNNVNLDIGNLSLSFHGSLWDWLLNLFKGLIKNAVSSAISSVFKSAITNFIVSDINPMLAAIPMTLPLHLSPPYDVAEARFGLTANPTFTTTYTGVELQGDIVPIANPVAPPITPPTLPPFNPATAAHYLQMQLSSYTFMSALHTLNAAGLLHWDLPSSKIPLGFNDSGAYTLVAPGLPAAYPHAVVSINVGMSAMPTLDFSTAGVNISAPLLLDFVVQTGGAGTTAFTLGALSTLTAALTVGKDSTGAQALMGHLSYLGAQLSVAHTAVGPINSGLLQTLVDVTLKGVVVPLVNEIFANGIPLPSASGVTMTNTAISYGNGFVTMASDFTISPNFMAVTPYVYTVDSEGDLLARPVGDVMEEVDQVVVAARPASLRHHKRAEVAA